MKQIKFGAGFTIFLIFFGVALFDAIREANRMHLFFWVATGCLFLMLDNLKKNSGS